MTDLIWHEAYPPPNLTLAQLVPLVRVLTGRPALGFARRQPVVVFELWLSKGAVRWLVGSDVRIGRNLANDLAAQMPGLSLTSVTDSPRREPTTAREVRPSNPAYPLRLDTADAVAAGLLGLGRRLAVAEWVVVQWVIGPTTSRTSAPVKFSPLETLGFVEPRKPDAGERTAWREKVAEPLFAVRGRVGAVAVDARRAAQLIGPALGALAHASGSQAQVGSGWGQSSHIARQLFTVPGHRTWNGSVNAAELAVLLGWPVDGIAAPGADHVYGRPARALIAEAPEEADTDRVLGRSTHPRSRGALVHLPAASIASHVHVIAPTGAGKSTLLAHWVLQDLAAGRSVFLLEPKGDLVADVLARLPIKQRGQVRIVQPGIPGPVLGFNPLAGPLDDAERRADSLLALFREVFGSGLGPRSSDVLLHALIMAARLEDGTLPDVPVILSDSAFRRRVLAKTSDPLTIAPWAAWFDGLSELERSRVVMPILNKTRAFTTRGPIRRLLGQPNPGLRLDELFARPLLVLVNLNAGAVGPETARLLGSLLLSQLRDAIQRQTMQPAAARAMVSVFVDEWQLFVAGMDFADMLATARGMNVGFTLAHQHLAQLSPNLRAAVLANSRSRVAFRPAKADAKELAGTLGGQLTADDLLRLPAFHAAASILSGGASSQPFAVSTLPLPNHRTNVVALQQDLAARFGLDPDEIDQLLIRRWQQPSSPAEGAIGHRKRGQS